MASNQQHHLDSNLNKFYQFDLDWKRLPDRLQQSQTVQGIKHIICREKRVRHMDRPENDNALMMKLINNNNN